MNPITPHHPSQAPGYLPSSASTPSLDAESRPEQTAAGTHTPPRNCTEVRALATRLDRAIDSAGSNDPDTFVTLCLADLRKMDSWGITIHGETLQSYFDLGSIDDVEQRYPVTLDEARLLRRAVAALNHDGCHTVSRRARWRRTV